MKPDLVKYAIVKTNLIKLERYKNSKTDSVWLIESIEFETSPALMTLHCQMIDYWGLW